ncbi:hypothetical protein T4E_12254 [Trichinella pseudospiralis]|uniref:Uncharacterized protein n=1 Tax=Trichinella pseudospiralis TaxID=6337 RepID=A0A0V0XND0_TRIPS|nr:hypothetical protein T4E_12254 [Trichinella pseudospiralis]
MSMSSESFPCSSTAYNSCTLCEPIASKDPTSGTNSSGKEMLTDVAKVKCTVNQK